VSKSATLFISTGDALDVRTNNVEAAFIDGGRSSSRTTRRPSTRQYKARQIQR
jgi:hypothetical protein